MGLVKEFREFALRGNVLDLAVGVIIGAAFGKIVNSVINDVIMPFVGIAGKADFTNLYVALSSKVTEAAEKAAVDKLPFGLEEARKAGPVLAYGNFITEIINFLILAACVFVIIKLFNTARKRFEAQQVPPPPAGPSGEERVLVEIRDLLRSRA